MSISQWANQRNWKDLSDVVSTRDRKREARRLMRKPAGPFLPVDLSACEYVPPKMTRAYENNRYVVMIWDGYPTTHGPAIKCMIQRHDDTPISWAEKQAVKNEIFGNETVAIEYYPAQADLVDEFNIYWLWVFPPGTLPMP